ncbi:MAG: hypothetical protein GEU74_07380 [Nitriliruptorales bacterium]|nr:hypothetical protein [Nitriliruptorales bacterium]
MAPIAFRSQPLPRAASSALRERLSQAHRDDPFSALDPRHAARRTTGIAEDLGLEVMLYRGALDLLGSEIDHVWVDFQGRVIDVAFPLFLPSFVQVLRDYVVGDADAADLDVAASGAGLDERVLGEFPRPLRYRGEPVWSARR